jgi:hypothetical protein
VELDFDVKTATIPRIGDPAVCAGCGAVFDLGAEKRALVLQHE